MEQFNLSPNVDTNKVFLVNKSQIEGRLDVDFYQPELLKLEYRVRKKSKHKLSNYIYRLASGATPLKSEEDKYYTDDVSVGIPFLRVQNLKTDSCLDFSGLKYINQETHDKFLKRSQVKENDLLVKITGVGRMAIAAVAPKDFIGNTNQHMVVVKTQSLDSQYLANYLNLDFVEKLASRRATGGTRPALDFPALRSIPIIEDIDFLGLRFAQVAYKEKYQQAKDLLESINQYLLNELGIELPQQDNSLNSRIFIRKSSEIIGGKFDANSYRTYYKELKFAIKNTHYTTSKLYDLVGIGCGGNWGSDLIDDYDAEKFVISTVIRATEFDNQGNLNFIPDKVKKRLISKNIFDKINLQLNDLIIEKSGGSENQPVGRIAIIDEDAVSKGFLIHSNFIHKISVTSNLVYPDYLFYFLKLTHFIKLTESMQSQTNGIRNLIMSEYLAQTIIIPSLDKQQEIVTHIQNLRHQAKQLEQDAEQILADAKREIERSILGE